MTVPPNDDIRTPKEIRQLWRDLSDINFDPNEDDDLILATDFLHFEAGSTTRDDIWHWFDDVSPNGVKALMDEVAIEDFFIKNLPLPRSEDADNPQTTVEIIDSNGDVHYFTKEHMIDHVLESCDSIEASAKIMERVQGFIKAQQVNITEADELVDKFLKHITLEKINRDASIAVPAM